MLLMKDNQNLNILKGTESEKRRSVFLEQKCERTCTISSTLAYDSHEWAITMRKLPLSYIQSHTRLSYIYFQPSPAHLRMLNACLQGEEKIAKKREIRVGIWNAYVVSVCARSVFVTFGISIKTATEYRKFFISRTNFSSATFRRPPLYISRSRRRVCRYSNCYEYRLPNYANNDPGIRYQREIGGEKGEIRHERREWKKKKTIKFIRSSVCSSFHRQGARWVYVSFSSIRPVSYVPNGTFRSCALSADSSSVYVYVLVV